MTGVSAPVAHALDRHAAAAAGDGAVVGSTPVDSSSADRALATAAPAPRARDAVDGVQRVREVGGIEEYRLTGNGLRVLFMPMRAAPVALLMLTYAVGSRHEVAGTRGASHMLEHMMFKGTPRFDPRAGTSIFDLLHPLGAQANATTWLDRTHYYDLVPLEHLDLAMAIEADRMRHLRIAPDDLAAERNVVLNEHDGYAGNALEKLNQAVWRAAFRTHPYGDPVIGTRRDILGLTRERLLAHYDHYYWPDNATLTVIGDVPRAHALACVHRHFAHLPAAPHAFVDAAPPPAPSPRQRRVVVEHGDGAEWLMLARRTPPGACAQADALELLGHVLAGGRSSRLHRPLLGEGLAISVWSCVSRLRHEGLFQIQALLGGQGGHARVEALIRGALRAVAEEGVTAEELDRARGRVRGGLLLSRDGPVAVSLQLNEAIAAGDWTAYTTVVTRIDAVTADDLRRAARDCLAGPGRVVGHLVRRAPAVR